MLVGTASMAVLGLAGGAGFYFPGRDGHEDTAGQGQVRHASAGSDPLDPDTGVLDIEAALAPRISGAPDAPIHVAEYFSLSCGHCADFHQGTFNRIKSDWIDTGRVLFEYRDYPLTGPTIFAHALARAVPVDAYEEMLDILFRKQAEWAGAGDPVSELAKIARVAGIGRDTFSAIIGNRPYLEGIVAIAQRGADNWNINSTPSFVVNDEDVIRGNVDYDEFRQTLEKHSA